MIFLRFASKFAPLLFKWLAKKLAQESLEPSPEVSLPVSSQSAPQSLSAEARMLSIKDTVKLHGLQPEAVPIIIIANEVYASMGYDCVITSVTDSQHTAKSLHPFGYSVDLRTRHVPVEKQAALAKEIATRLGPQYDVVLESDHIHAEFDCR